jgi:hypothetical protein
MDHPVRQDIVQQLINNTEEIIAAGRDSDDGPERLFALAERQKMLLQTLNKHTRQPAPDISRTSIVALQNLVAKAVDAVRGEMDRNRGSMQVAGVKKKVLHAYGTVTVSNPPSI